MIGIDWGTSNFRAFLLGDDGTERDHRAAACGVLHIANRCFAETLRAEIGDWLQHGEHRVLLCGAIGSREGWQEAPYLPCPAGVDELSRAVVSIPFAGATVRLVPGLTTIDAQGVPDTMRSEETQVVGIRAALGEHGLICLPGTHSKWVQLRHGRITSFATYLTGEAFEALHEHTILGRTMHAGPLDWSAFDRGLVRAGEPGGWLHHLFGVRALGIAGRLNEVASVSYLSGLLIGHEVRAAMPLGELVHLVGDPALTALYAHAITAAGGEAKIEDEDAAARGLTEIARGIAWT